jgi:hypothetical protein
MIKKLALLAAAGLLYIGTPAAPAAAQGINVQIGGGGYHHNDRGYHRGPGYRHSRAYMRRDVRPRHYGHRGPRSRTIIVR